MNWNERLQKIIDLIEEHLQRTEEEICPAEIARLAGCSFSFFQKIFSYMNGISLGEYVRNRKLTLAGYDLKSTNMKVIDISYHYGYDSPTSFTKAFRKFHGVSPKKARTTDVELRVYPKMQISMEQEFFWRVEHKPAFFLLGTSKVMYSSENLEQQIPEFWSTCQKDGTFLKLSKLDRGTPPGMFGVFEEEEDHHSLKYSIMVFSRCDKSDEFQILEIPESTWAIFDCRGPVPQAIQNGWKYLQEEWLVQYPFGHASLPELEWYGSGDSNDLEYLSQIWIPIIEKRKCEK